MDVPATSVIRVVLQYLQESNLPVAFEALQRESGVPLNAVPGDATAAQAAPDAAALGAQAPFFADVLAGRWDKALPAAAAFELPAPVAAALYEHVVLELVEHRDANSARAMLRSTVALGTWMRRHEPQRYARLDNLVKRCGTLNGTREVYGDTDRDARRRALALQLHGEVSVAAPGRLLDLVGCGLRYLRVTGRMFELAPHVRKRARGGGDGGAAGGPPLAWDLLMNTELAPLAKARRRDADGDEAPVIPPLADGARHAQAIRFGSTSHPTCASYSPDGFFLATGSSDGFVELWDARTCKLATSLAYQKRDEMLAHDACVTCVAFSRDGELLASGDAAGTLKVWRVASGRCLRKWEAVHGAQQPVRAAVFSEDASAGGGPDAAALAIVSVGGSAGDGAAKLLGLKGGAVLRDYALGRASTARLRVDGAPSAAVYLHPFGGGATLLAVGTTDGRVCVFAAKSGEHVRTFEVPQYREGEPRPAVVHLSAYPPQPVGGGAGAGAAAAGDQQTLLLVGTHSTRAHIFDATTGAVVHEWRAPGEEKHAASREKETTGGEAALAIPRFATFAVSARGKYLYVVDDAGTLLCYELAASGGGGIAAAVARASGDPLAKAAGASERGSSSTGAATHPFEEVLATLSDDGSGVKVWRTSL